MLRMMAAVQPIRPDFVFLTGWEAALVPMLVMGCQGGTNATSGVIPEVTRKLFDLVKSQRLDEARKLQLRLIELFDAMLFSADFPEGFRAAVELRGFDLGRSRQPQSESQQIDRAALQKVLHCIMADFGVVDEPREGCASRSGNIERDRVAQITERVIHELREQGVL
jgi:dihydrodipicolinate synthase/N-acetylneuraminate lyase